MEHIRTVMADRLQNRSVRKGFTKAPNWFLESSDFTVYEKIIGLIIQKHRMNKKNAWPSQEKIAKQAGCSISTVKKALNGLQSKGVLKRQKSRTGRNNIYVINI